MRLSILTSKQQNKAAKLLTSYFERTVCICSHASNSLIMTKFVSVFMVQRQQRLAVSTAEKNFGIIFILCNTVAAISKGMETTKRGAKSIQFLIGCIVNAGCPE